MADPDLGPMEESVKKLVVSLDKGVHMEALLEEEGEWIAILSKGTHSDRANLAKELIAGYMESGKGEKELRHALGKVIGKLNRLGQKRG